MIATDRREADRNKLVVGRMLDAADRGDLTALAACYAADYRDHTMTGSRAAAGKDATMAAFREIAKAFPDVRHTIDALIAEADQVVLRVSATGTHRADYRGLPASGRAVTMTHTAIYRLRDGLIVERWADGASSILAQLGEPAPPEGAAVRVLRAADAPWEDDVAGARFWSLPLERLSVTYFRLDPGARFPAHAHDNEQITLVLGGQLTFAIGPTKHVLGPGDAIAIPGAYEHAVVAGDEPVVAIDAWSPPPTHLGGGTGKDHDPSPAPSRTP